MTAYKDKKENPEVRRVCEPTPGAGQQKLAVGTQRSHLVGGGSGMKGYKTTARLAFCTHVCFGALLRHVCVQLWVAKLQIHVQTRSVQQLLLEVV
jgi:hypothetical protein